MHHCVGSYIADVVSGHSVIYRIHWQDKHIGTMEIKREYNNTYRITQISGPCNEQLDSEVDRLIRSINYGE